MNSKLPLAIFHDANLHSMFERFSSNYNLGRDDVFLEKIYNLLEDLTLYNSKLEMLMRQSNLNEKYILEQVHANKMNCILSFASIMNNAEGEEYGIIINKIEKFLSSEMRFSFDEDQIEILKSYKQDIEFKYNFYMELKDLIDYHITKYNLSHTYENLIGSLKIVSRCAMELSSRYNHIDQKLKNDVKNMINMIDSIDKI